MPFAHALLTPGAYLKHRRVAAGLLVRDVAEAISTNPAMPAHERKLHLDSIEADSQPATLRTLVALRGVFAFDLDVIARLEAIIQHQDVAPPQLCRVCACSQEDGCAPDRGGPCGWASADLCTCCTVLFEPALAIEAHA